MILQAVQDPRESAARILSVRPKRDALWLLLALVAVVSTLLSQVGVLLSGASGDALMGPFGGAPITMAAIQAMFMLLMVFAVYQIGQWCGGTGTFDETLAIVIWLQVILVALQLLQFVLLLITPAVAMLVGFAAIALFFYLLCQFIVVLHDFRSAGMVFVGVILSMFGLMFVMGLLMAMLGVTAGLPTA